jgi:hypothetical protein
MSDEDELSLEEKQARQAAEDARKVARGARAPVELTIDLTDKILNYIEMGMRPERAAKLAGIPLTRFRNWIVKGKKTGAPRAYEKLAFGVDQAESLYQFRIVAVINKALAMDPKHAFSVLQKLGAKIEILRGL